MPEQLRPLLSQVSLRDSQERIKLMAKSPNIFAIVSKKYFQHEIALEFKNLQRYAKDELINRRFGTKQFEWRISPEEISNIYYSIMLSKFSPWIEILSLNILRITEGHLLALPTHKDLIPPNRNPHRYIFKNKFELKWG